MKILLIAPEPFFTVRGTPLAVLELSKALCGMGHSIDLLTYPMGDDVSVERLRIIRCPGIPGIKDVAPAAFYLKLLLDPLLFAHAFWMLLFNRYDIIHCVEESIVAGVCLKKIFHIPVVCDMDSDMVHQLSYKGYVKEPVLLNALEKMERWAVRGSDAVVTVCTSLTEHARAVAPSVPVFQVEDIPMGLDEKISGDELSLLRAEYGLEGKKIVLYAGNFESYQGVELLIQSAPLVISSFEGVRFVFVGGEQDQIESMGKMARDMGVADYCIFAGKQPPAAAGAFMQLSDVLVSPRREGTNTPMKIYSYMASGRPVVATKIPSHTQVLNRENAVLVEVSARDMARGILEVLNDAGLASRISKAAQEVVAQNFSREKFTDKIGGAYRYLAQLVAKRSPRSNQ